ncbi:hypothetical protein ACIBRY_03570 [Streptomyces anulatus]
MWRRLPPPSRRPPAALQPALPPPSRCPRQAHWTAVQESTGVLLAVVVPTTVIVSWNVISGWEAGEIQALLGNLGSLAVMVGTAVRLWRTRRA